MAYIVGLVAVLLGVWLIFSYYIILAVILSVFFSSLFVYHISDSAFLAAAWFFLLVFIIDRLLGRSKKGDDK